MIRRLSFSNFCSFLEETVVDFTTSAKTSTDDSFVGSKYGDKVSLLTGVFGPNAAGKTNLLKALAFVSFFMRDSYRVLKPEQVIPLDRFAGPSGDEAPARFELEFDGEDGRYLYSVSLTPKRVEEETLKRFSPKTGQFAQVLSRKQKEDGKQQLRTFEQFTEGSLLREALLDRPNASLIAAGLQTGRKEFKAVSDALGVVATNVNRSGKSEQLFEGITGDMISCSEFFQKHPEHHDALRELLQAADIGIEDFKIRPIQVQMEGGETKESFLIFFKHQGPKGSFELPVGRESSGTKRLFMLFETFIKALSEGGIVAIDEMESDLHPHLIPTILSLFNNPEINTRKAQLFFTCHHVEILNHLMKEQIIFVEKTKDCVSEAYRLDSIKGVRREENFFANYNSGRYGAVPEPELIAF